MASASGSTDCLPRFQFKLLIPAPKRVGIFIDIYGNMTIIMAVSFCAASERRIFMEYIIHGSLGNLFGVLSVPDTDGPVPLVILCHGFGSNMQGHQDYTDYFFSRGLAVFSFDFCGGGRNSRSDGTMTEMSLLTEAEDLNAVLDTFVNDKRFSGIFLWGASQGGFISSYVASQRSGDIKALVLEFPAYVIHDDARKRELGDGTFPERYTVLGNEISHVYGETAVSFDIYDLIGSYTGDVLILHGDQDDIVPLSYSERAVKVFPSAKLVVMPGQKHGFTGESRAEAMKKAAEFIMAH